MCIAGVATLPCSMLPRRGLAQRPQTREFVPPASLVSPNEGAMDGQTVPPSLPPHLLVKPLGT